MRLPLQSIKGSLLLGVLLFPGLAHAQAGTDRKPGGNGHRVRGVGVGSLCCHHAHLVREDLRGAVHLEECTRDATGSAQPNHYGALFRIDDLHYVPVVQKMYHTAGAVSNSKDIFSEASVKSLFDASRKAKEPLRHFLHATRSPRTESFSSILPSGSKPARNRPRDPAHRPRRPQLRQVRERRHRRKRDKPRQPR